MRQCWRGGFHVAGVSAGRSAQYSTKVITETEAPLIPNEGAPGRGRYTDRA